MSSADKGIIGINIDIIFIINYYLAVSLKKILGLADRLTEECNGYRKNWRKIG